jgi:hypothetical protein
MIHTDNYLRWQRVDSVIQTPTGILAELHGEQLKIDVVRADVLRIKISRGGVFDDPPTFAVCVDPLIAPAEFSVERGGDAVRLTTAACVASLWLDPFRIDVHRSDGLRDSERRIHNPASLPARGRHLWVGRENGAAQSQGSRLHNVEHRRTQSVRDVGIQGRQGG